ncbi:DUF4833 domain-containing protein [Flavobacterium sp. W1B]|uniref:DUF4833 domain-containing protein n=1 Tax=Flavobacterium sp. W1B TaxID=3394146 RepID=UPI0039BCC6C2
MKKLFLFFQLLLVSVVSAQKDYPIPPAAENRLFYIQHGQNHNTYVYDANFIETTFLSDSEPVSIYRIVYTEGGVKKELTKTQQKLAYGLNTKKVGQNQYELSLVSYPKQKLYLRVDKKAKAYVETTINGKKMILDRMFLQSNKKSSGFKVKLDCILFFGKNTAGENISEKYLL